MNRKIEIATATTLDIKLRGLNDRREELNIALYEEELSRRKKLKIHRYTLGIGLFFVLLLLINLVLTISIETTALYTGIGMLISFGSLAIFGLAYLFQELAYRARIKKVFIPSFIKVFFPQFEYEHNLHIESYKIPELLNDSGSNRVEIQKGEDYLSGRIGSLFVELSELEMTQNLLIDGPINGFKGIFMRIAGFPKQRNLDFVLNNEPLQKVLKEMESFWNKKPALVLDKEGYLCVFVHTRKSFLESSPREHFLESELFQRVYLELYHLLHFVELLDIDKD